MLSIRVRLQCTDALGATQLLDITSGGVAGRDPAGDIVLEHPTVSRKHVRFSVRGDEVEVQDLGSANGTFRQQPPARPAPGVARRRRPVAPGHLHRRVFISPGGEALSPPAMTHVPSSRDQTTVPGGSRVEPQLLLARISQRRMLSDPPPGNRRL
ncbi:MAG: FHA domain-containing protein [Rhodanobacteraceae bacterium]|nr:FHA domain-containing protein [Rhodanobacteraceae bacterium]